MLRVVCIAVFVGSVLTAFVAPPALAGAVTGTVKFEGEPPKMRPIQMNADPACHSMHGDEPMVNEALVLGPDQTMANILVSVSKGLPDKEWPVPSSVVELTQKGCRYAPHVFGIRAGQTLKILNPDPTMHNVNGQPVKNPAFNRAMPKTLKEIEVVFETPEDPFPFKCDVHPWMRAYCAVFSHPFFMVTAEDGKYTLDGLEPGEYEITAWHEKLGPQTATVTVPADGNATQDFSFARP